MNKFKSLFLISIINTFLLLSINIFSQQNNFRTYSIEDGLPHSNVYCLLQDSKGYIWIGTGAGVSRFDGNEFKTFTKKEGIAGSTVRSIMEDSQQRIWIGTDQGLSMYDGYTFTTINKDGGLAGNTVLSLLEDSRHSIWAGTDDGGFNKIDFGKDSINIEVFGGERINGLMNFDIYEDRDKHIWVTSIGNYGGIDIITVTEDTSTVKGLFGGYDIPTTNILSLKEDKDGNIWVGTYGEGVFKMAPSENNSWSVISYDALNKETVWDIFTDSNGEIWIATEEGLIRFTPTKDGIDSSKIITYTTQEGLPLNQITCLLKDKEGNLWMGTNGSGLVKYMGDHFAHYAEKDGLPSTIIHDITQDHYGNYWLATNGGGLSRLNFLSNKPIFNNYSVNNGLVSDVVTSIAVDNANSIWVGTIEGLQKYDGKKFIKVTGDEELEELKIKNVFIDKDGKVWWGSIQSLNMLDENNFNGWKIRDMFGMEVDEVKIILQDKKGNIWAGMGGGLLGNWHKEESGYTGRTYDDMEGLYVKNVNAITEDHLGNIWIGTNGGGLYKLDIASQDSLPITLIADDSLLSSNAINSLIFQDDNHLIIATSEGFDKITLDENQKITKVKNYNATDGFIGIECNENAIYKDKDGNIWFGTVNGATRYNPNVENNNIPAPEIHITSIELFFKTVNWKEKADSVTPWFNLPFALELPYSDNHLTFHFSGISFTNPQKVLYQYLLEGQESNWSPAIKENKVTYSGINPGEYTFKVKAINADGIWSEPVSFHFVINPPWYQTTWFYITCIVVLILSITFYIKTRERKLKEEKAILEQKVVERTKEVVAQKEIIEEKNKEIMDSINYAKGIQDAILPAHELIQQHLPQSCVLFKPKDVVSGDFYYFIPVSVPNENSKKQEVIWTAADCTGHGVPGAFVSMVGANGLNRTVNEYGITDPAKILDKLAVLVEQTFSKRKDGMDMSLCKLLTERDKHTLQFAAANNPLWIVRKKGNNLFVGNEELKPDMEEEGIDYVLYEIKADKQPIGAFENRQPFTNHTFNVEKGDSIYVFTDGFADQFGGPKGKKFKYKPFKQAILNFQDQPMSEQKDILNQIIEGWKGGMEQVDDICVFGVKVE